MKQISTPFSWLMWRFSWLKWLLKDKPMVQYPGYHCGICGKWVNKPISVPEYESAGKWWDTWGICEKCEKWDFSF